MLIYADILLGMADIPDGLLGMADIPYILGVGGWVKTGFWGLAYVSDKIQSTPSGDDRLIISIHCSKVLLVFFLIFV